MNKWRKRARKWRKEASSYKGYYIDTDLALKTERIQNALAGPASGAAAALNKAEELRRDNVRLSTELARVQGECDKWQRAAENCDRDYTTQMYRDNALLAWQRGVREAWKECAVCTGYNTRLGQAIEAEPTASEFDRKAYLAQVEQWGTEGAEPKEEP